MFRGEGDQRRLAGHLLAIHGRIYEPDGEVEGVTAEQAERHNELLDAMLIEGLKTCELGQRGTFYYCARKKRVATFTGKVIADDVVPVGNVVTFQYRRRTFQGRLRKDEEFFEFRRVN